MDGLGKHEICERVHVIGDRVDLRDDRNRLARAGGRQPRSTVWITRRARLEQANTIDDVARLDVSYSVAGRGVINAAGDERERRPQRHEKLLETERGMVVVKTAFE